jgi:hypothetical protein
MYPGRYRAPLGRRMDYRSRTQGDAHGLRNHDPLGRPDMDAHVIHYGLDDGGRRASETAGTSRGERG